MKLNLDLVGDFKGWKKAEYTWLSLALVTIIVLCYMWQSRLIDYVSSIAGVLCVVLVAKQKTSNYIYGFINVLLYAYIAYTNKLYGDFALNAFFYLPFQFIGFYFWNKYESVESRSLSKKQLSIISLSSIVAILLYSVYLKNIGDIAPLADSTSTILSIVATFLMVARFTEQWICWIIVNVVSVFMWIVAFRGGSTDIGTLAMWCLFLINSVYGYFSWKKNENESEEVNLNSI